MESELEKKNGGVLFIPKKSQSRFLLQPLCIPDGGSRGRQEFVKGFRLDFP